MKTSVIEVRDMLSVLSVTGVEARIGEVGGVESVTVNYAAGTATVRFDETRLDVADIKADVRQSGYDHEGGAPPGGSAASRHDTQAAPAEIPGATPKTPPGANDTAGASPSGSPPPNPSAPRAEPSASAGATPPVADATAASDAAPPGDASKGKAAPAVK